MTGAKIMSDTDDKVGYGRPPKRSRFKKGGIGNPRGRPKGHKNFATQFIEAVNETVPITLEGRQVRVTKLQATIHAMVDKGTKGDDRSMVQVLDRVAELEARAEEAERAQAPVFTDADREIIADIHRRMMECDEGDGEN
jgi:hypothetical protein